MPAAKADECIERAIRDFRIQGGELKGKNLTKTPAGRKAINRILADKSSLFYDIGFHKFVAHWLYIELIATGKSLANNLLLDFEKMMRQQDIAGLEKLFGVPAGAAPSHRISEQIFNFALVHPRKACQGNWNPFAASEQSGTGFLICPTLRFPRSCAIGEIDSMSWTSLATDQNHWKHSERHLIAWWGARTRPTSR